jgi:hypothetical protein
VTSDLQKKLDRSLDSQYNKLYATTPRGQRNKRIYCWRRYLSGLKGFRTISLGDLLANIGMFSEYIVVADPSAREIAWGGSVYNNRLIVAHKDFALKCLAIGLPDLYAMKFRMPSRWNTDDRMGLEFKP